ncbi:MAG: hypothetical protein HOV80_13790, partial [Polyangiaceae bacterium]|nr:hypothetical protein [Polyangiaceae bacterium]
MGEDRSTVALEKAREGIALYERGEHAAALALFQEANALYHSPVLVLYAARAQRKLGKLADAAASFRSVTEESIGESAPPPWHKAQGDARLELETLEKELEAERARPTPPSLPPVVPQKQPPRAPPPVKPPLDEGLRPWWTFGIVATTVGGAALVGGAVVGGLAYEKSRVADTKLPPSCTPDHSCPDFVDAARITLSEDKDPRMTVLVP